MSAPVRSASTVSMADDSLDGTCHVYRDRRVDACPPMGKVPRCGGAVRRVDPRIGGLRELPEIGRAVDDVDTPASHVGILENDTTARSDDDCAARSTPLRTGCTRRKRPPYPTDVDLHRLRHQRRPPPGHRLVELDGNGRHRHGYARGQRLFAELCPGNVNRHPRERVAQRPRPVERTAGVYDDLLCSRRQHRRHRDGLGGVGLGARLSCQLAPRGQPGLQAWRGVAWRGVAWRGVSSSTPR